MTAFIAIRIAMVNRIIDGIPTKIVKISNTDATISRTLPISNKKMKPLKSIATEIKISISRGTARLKALANNKAVTIKSPIPKILTISFILAK